VLWGGREEEGRGGEGREKLGEERRKVWEIAPWVLADRRPSRKLTKVPN